MGASDSAGRRVVASFYPLEYVAERVAGDHAEVTGLTAPGQEPHDLELTFKQTADVAEADVLVFSHGLQPAVDDAVDQSERRARGRRAEVADAASRGRRPALLARPAAAEHVAAAVEEQLAEADPEHRADYAANLAALQDDLTALDRDFEEGLADCARDTSWSATTRSATSRPATG